METVGSTASVDVIIMQQHPNMYVNPTAAMVAFSFSACCLSGLASAGTAAIGRPMGLVIQSSRASQVAVSAVVSACSGLAPPAPPPPRGLPPSLPLPSPVDGESGSAAAAAASALEPAPHGTTD